MTNKNDLLERQQNAKAAKSNMIEAYKSSIKENADRLYELQKERAKVGAARLVRHSLRDERKRVSKSMAASQAIELKEAAKLAEASRIAEVKKQENEAMIGRIVSDHMLRRSSRNKN